MSEEPIAPDWPEEYDPLVAKLGTPLSVHHFPEDQYRRRIRRIWFVIISTIVWPIIGIALSIMVGMAPNIGLIQVDIMIFGFAVWYLIVTRRHRRFRIHRYETGILSWQRGRLLSFAWTEIDYLRLSGDKFVEVELKPNGDGVPCIHFLAKRRHWLSRFSPLSRLLYQEISLFRSDGEEIKIPSYLTDFPVLLEAAQVPTFTTRWPEVWEKFVAGEEVEIRRNYRKISGSWLTLYKLTAIKDTVRVSRKGITFPSLNRKKLCSIEWSQVKGIRIAVAVGFEIYSRWYSPVIIGALGWFDNPHVFLHILNEGLRLHYEESIEEAEANDTIKV